MAMNVTELMEKRAKLWEATKKFLEDHTDKDGKISGYAFVDDFECNLMVDKVIEKAMQLPL